MYEKPSPKTEHPPTSIDRLSNCVNNVSSTTDISDKKENIDGKSRLEAQARKFHLSYRPVRKSRSVNNYKKYASSNLVNSITGKFEVRGDNW